MASYYYNYSLQACKLTLLLILAIFRGNEHVSNPNPETTIKSFHNNVQLILQLIEHMPRDGGECLHF